MTVLRTAGFNNAEMLNILGGTLELLIFVHMAASLKHMRAHKRRALPFLLLWAPSGLS